MTPRYGTRTEKEERVKKTVPASSTEAIPASYDRLTDLLRYRVLLHVFEGDVEEWLQLLEAAPLSACEAEDEAFLRWVQDQLRYRPSFLFEVTQIVRSVEAELANLPLRTQTVH